ncbi:MAG: dockerin type I domain-containing protein, partial [Planctomycetota bacterium]
FVGAPQEFFASIANEWFTDSRKTVELGLVRFDAGWLCPINQALFFAEVYSQGSDSTWFYTIDTSGNVTAESFTVRRNAGGLINELVYDGQRHIFSLDGLGEVQSYVITTVTDVNGDCVVNVLDLIELLLCFGQPATAPCATADVNQDGGVDVLDLIDLLLAFGTTCP